MPWTQSNNGWQQDANGQLWEIWENSFGRTDRRKVATPALPPERARLYERITVHSKGHDAALGIVPETELQKRKIQAILDGGPTYESIVFFHMSGSSLD